MRERSARLGNAFLRFSSLRSVLRRIPIVGDFLAWIGRKILPADSLVWVQIQNGPAAGLWMRLNPRTGQIAQQAASEIKMQQTLTDFLRPGMTFYDLGANIGFFSLIAARIVGAGGKVFSFEADPEIAERLRENLARNKFAQASVEQRAVWSEPGSVSFARVDPNTSPDRGLGHVSPNSSAAPEQITVEATSLDEFTRTHPAPDLIKCDVEGAEVAVFQGAMRLLQEAHPILLVEMHGSENHGLLTRRFAEYGYTCRDLDDTHILAIQK